MHSGETFVVDVCATKREAVQTARVMLRNAPVLPFVDDIPEAELSCDQRGW